MSGTVKDLYQRRSETFAERRELPLDEWREIIEEWGQSQRHTFQIGAGRSPEADEGNRRLAEWARPKLGL
jgi:hypothetical protein